MAASGKTNGVSGAEAEANFSLLSAQMSWMRSDLSNLRTLLSWVRTSVSMIGFGFTIYNFYSGVFEGLGGGPRSHEAARNLGMALVAAGTVAVIIAVWNYWSINQYLEGSSVSLDVPKALKLRWYYSYVLSAVLGLIGLITFLFMLRVI
jgi:putative membrane protein